MCGQLVVVVPVASTFVPADPDAVVPDAVVSEVVVPSSAPPDAGRLVPPSDTGWSPDDGAGLVIGSVEPSVLLRGRLRLVGLLRHVRGRTNRSPASTACPNPTPRGVPGPAPRSASAHAGRPGRPASTATGRPSRRLRRRAATSEARRRRRRRRRRGRAGARLALRRRATGPRARPVACRPASRPGTPAPGRAAAAPPRRGPAGISVLIACSSRAAVSVSPVDSAVRTASNRLSTTSFVSTDSARSGSTTFWTGHRASPGIAFCEPEADPADRRHDDGRGGGQRSEVAQPVGPLPPRSRCVGLHPGDDGGHRGVEVDQLGDRLGLDLGPPGGQHRDEALVAGPPRGPGRSRGRGHRR